MKQQRRNELRKGKGNQSLHCNSPICSQALKMFTARRAISLALFRFYW